MTYREYLLSPEWAIIRTQRLTLDNYECVLCSSVAAHVHHRRYPDTLGTETINDLVSLCAECHSKHHAINQDHITRIKRVPITEEMRSLRKSMEEAERNGDEQLSLKLYTDYMNIRRMQIVG